jgi:hypothetical protein
MNRTFLRLAVFVSTSSVVWVEGCGGSETTTDAGSDATAQDTSISDAPAGDTAPSSDAGLSNDTGLPPGMDSGCASLSDGGCLQCCADQDPDAATAFAKEAALCACGKMGSCAVTCSATLCKGKAPDAKCTACILSPDAGNCVATIESAVCGDADTTCQAVAACFMSCE